jgi:hypothetical protein
MPIVATEGLISNHYQSNHNIKNLSKGVFENSYQLA